MPEDKPKSEPTPGRKSLMFLLVIAATILFMIFQSTLSEFQGEKGWALFWEFYFFGIFVWIPLSIASLRAGIIAIAENRGRIQGIIALGIISVPLVWMIVSNMRS